MYAECNLWNNRILLVDDDERIQMLFRRILKTPSFRVPPNEEIFGAPAATFDLYTASQGSDAYEMVEAANVAGKPFAAAFMDMEMPPGWDGIDTIARIRQIDAQIQIAICTGHWDERRQERLAMIDGGAQMPVIGKPFQNSEVHQLASRLMMRWNRSWSYGSSSGSSGVSNRAAAATCA